MAMLLIVQALEFLQKWECQAIQAQIIQALEQWLPLTC